MRRIGTTDLEIDLPLSLGGNVFGWTAGEQDAYAVLDAFVDAGGSFVDSADVYSEWADGHTGGESEELLGRWCASRGRERLLLATKVGSWSGAPGLSRESIRTGAEASLRRLGTDVIDLYYAHRDDPSTPLEETLGAFDELVREGKVRHVAASNYSAPRLREALAVSEREGLARFVALQPHYNLVHREEYEGELAGLVADEGLSCVPYAALAGGFLAGKYRDGAAPVDSPRAAKASQLLDERGRRVLAALDAVAGETGQSVGAVSIAWLAAQPTVLAPIASARTAEQLPELVAGARLQLTADQRQRLTDASA